MDEVSVGGEWIPLLQPRHEAPRCRAGGRTGLPIEVVLWRLIRCGRGCPQLVGRHDPGHAGAVPPSGCDERSGSLLTSRWVSFLNGTIVFLAGKRFFAAAKARATHENGRISYSGARVTVDLTGV